MNHITIGVYPDGSYKVNVVRHEDLEEHIEYNKDFRPGRLLFVDGKYITGGCFKEEFQKKFIKEWEDKIGHMSIDSNIPSEIYV